MHARYAALLLLPLLAGCQQHPDRDDTKDKADTSTFDRRLACAELATSDKWDDDAKGPFLDSTFYSPQKDTCVFLMKNTHRGEKDGGIHKELFLIDALTRRQLWANDPESGDTDDQLTTKLNEALKNLQITP